MKTALIAITLAFAGLALNADAQNPGSTPAPGNTPGGGFGHGRAGQHRPQTPERIAAELMRKFDADKDGELSQTELAQALEALRERHPQGSGIAGHHAAQGGSGTPAPQDAQGGNRPRPSPDQVAARLIEKFSSDKKGLTVAELAKVIAERRANHGQHGSQQTGAPSTPPAS